MHAVYKLLSGINGEQMWNSMLTTEEFNMTHIIAMSNRQQLTKFWWQNKEPSEISTPCICTAKPAYSSVGGKDDTFKISDTNENVAFFLSFFCSGYGKQPRRLDTDQPPHKISKGKAA